MKIAVLSCLGISDERKGGDQVHVFNVAEGLAKLGHNVNYYHVPPKVQTQYAKDIAVEIPLPYRPGLAYPQHYLFNLKMIKGIIEFRPDVIITSGFNFAGNTAKKLMNIPLVTIIYQFGYRPAGLEEPLKRWMWHEYSSLKVMKAFLAYIHNELVLKSFGFTRIVTLSNHIKRVCESLKVKTPPHHIVSLGTGVYACNCQPAEKKFDVCCLSRLVWYKRVDLLIQAIRILNSTKRVSCVIVGDGNEREKLEKQAEGLPITFTGWFEGEPKHRILASSKVFCLPSPLEGFGIVFLEAMLHKLPLIFCDMPPMNEELKGCGFGFKNDDANDLAKKLNMLIEHPNKARALGETGYERVQEYFTWDKVCKRYDTLMKKMVDETRN